MKKYLSLFLVITILLSFTACSDGKTAVYVQSVAEMMGVSITTGSDYFSGVVVSENTVEIKKDMDKTVKELLVKAGDTVKKDQELFRYDTDSVNLTLQSQKLELEQINLTISNCKSQISELEKERESVPAADRLPYTVQIQSLEVELKEAQLSVKSKKSEIASTEAFLKNSAVKSPIEGQVQSINENENDQSGAYIVIQKSGAFRIKGTVGELQRGSVNEGDRIKVISRVDENAVWYGTVSQVKYDAPASGDSDSMMGGMDGGMSASKYPFYVDLESTNGLILGQHVYLQADSGQVGNAVTLSSGYICTGEDGGSYVWADNGGKLEKRAVTLGEYDDVFDLYTITDGLTLQDYIAFPDSEICHEGAPTTKEPPEISGDDPAYPDGEDPFAPGDDDTFMPEGGDDLAGGIDPYQPSVLPETGDAGIEEGE